MTSTTQTAISSGEFADRNPAITSEPERAGGQARFTRATYVLRQVAGVLAAIVLVWLVVMLFRHAHVVGLALLGVAIAAAAVTLFLRDRSLRRN